MRRETRDDRDTRSRGPEPERRGRDNERGRNGRGHEGHGHGKKHRKKRHHSLFWILLIVLLLGILVGVLIDRGIGFSGGEGWIGNLVGKTDKTITINGDDENKITQSIDINATITAAPTPVPTTVPVESAAAAYVTISESKIYMNDVEVTIDGLLAQLNTPTYKGGKVHLIDNYATKAIWDNVKTVLTNNGISYIEE